MPYEFKESAKAMETINIKSIEKTGSTLYLGTYSDGLYAYHIETGALKHLLPSERFKAQKALASIEFTVV